MVIEAVANYRLAVLKCPSQFLGTTQTVTKLVITKLRLLGCKVVSTTVYTKKP